MYTRRLQKIFGNRGSNYNVELVTYHYYFFYLTTLIKQYYDSNKQSMLKLKIIPK